MSKYFVLIKKVYWGESLVKQEQFFDQHFTLDDANRHLENEIYAYKRNLFEVANDLDLDIYEVRMSLTGTLRYSGELTYCYDNDKIKIEYVIVNKG